LPRFFGDSLVLDATFLVVHNVEVGQAWLASTAGAKPRHAMPEFFRHPLFLAILGLTALIALSARAILWLRKWRGDSANDQLSASELLTKFREMHVRGSLSADEYRTIKTKLATQYGPKLSDNDKTS
jgi:uncharacterized membrane protein